MVIAGIVMNFAAEGTARDASDRGSRVVVLADCCESVTDEWHEFAVTQTLPLIAQVVTADDFIRSLQGVNTGRVVGPSAGRHHPRLSVVARRTRARESSEYTVRVLPRVQKAKWSGRRVSNPRPSAWEADALPTELLPLGRATF